MTRPSRTGRAPETLDNVCVEVTDMPGLHNYWCPTAPQARALAMSHARGLGPEWTVDHDARPRPHFHVVHLTRRPDGRVLHRRVSGHFFYGGRRPYHLRHRDKGRGLQGELQIPRGGTARREGLVLPGSAGATRRPVITVGISPDAVEAWAAAEYELEFEGPAPAPDLHLQMRSALSQRRWPEAIAAATAMGLRDENRLVDLIFFASHPERQGRRISAQERSLAQEWRRIRDGLVRPALRAPSPRPPGADRRGAARSTTWLRRAWAGHAGEKTVRMVPLRLFRLPPTPVHPYTVDAWRAMERALWATGYRPSSAWNYNDRQITGGIGLSLHAYGIATDVDPACNPFLVTPDRPLVRFSTKMPQEQRCADVRARRADTSFTPEQVAAVEAITTVDGLQALAWGGRWRTVKDAMHFQINVSPEELRRGLRPN
jgi:hypothetical protein